MKLNSSGLQFRVLLLVAVAMAVALGASVFALSRVYGSIQELDRITREDFQSQQAILHASVYFKQQVQEWKNVLLRGADPAERDKYWEGFQKQEKETQGAVREARAGIRDPLVLAKLEAFIAAHRAAGERYRAGLEVFKAAKADPIAGDKAVAGIDRAAAQLLVDAEKLAEDHGAKATLEAVQRADASYSWSIAGTIGAMLVALVILSFFIRRAVLMPIGDAVRHAERIAQGDLTVAIRSESKDETGQLLAALARMNAGLSDVVSQVRNSAESVVTASNQVAAGTTDLSQRTEEQASSLEETAASMEELSSTVRQNADSAQKADELARGASKRAEQGGAEVVRVVLTMNEISRSAAKIADIISVIDAIAFQTNILALNAAVEAARAGEQGRGFAVVASEVRSLAQRSAQAAKEIKALIGDSVAKAKEGTDLVEQAGDTIQALVIDVKQVSALMGSIAEASAEQSRGVQQVNRTVTEMDKVVQHNASAVQQSAAAAEALRRQAQALVTAVSAFRIAAHEPQRAPRVAAPAARIANAPVALPTTKSNALPAKPKAVTAGPGDDWEEF
jgi:methyl-accepting chemotaxis protein-1 (serine sensor receptor)